MAVPRWVWAFGSALVLIPAAIALGSRRSRDDESDEGEGEVNGVDPFEATARPNGDDDEDENPYERKLPTDHGDCLTLGRQHPAFKFGSYRVCLTENQKKTLFKKRKGKKLGCGVFACAYGTSDPHKVVKFTRDSEDVAALLEAQETGVAPKVYETYKLRDGGHAIDTDDETPVYAIVAERLKTFSPAEREQLDNELPYVTDMIEKVDSEKFPSIADACRALREDGGECSAITQQTAEAAHKLKQAGIDWHDVHSGNIGLDKHGNVKILDLGVTGTQLKEQPQVLAGARKRLAKRNLRGV